ncbi:MAG: hypothetical protein V4734_13565 [Terriglobus sp.]
MKNPFLNVGLAVGMAAITLTPAASAQMLGGPYVIADASAGNIAPDALPDSPGAARFSSSSDLSGASDEGTGDIPFLHQKTPPQIAPKYKATILAGQSAVPLSVRDKLIFGIRRPAMPGQLTGDLFSAGWAHITDSRPHYGTDSAGFGERLGAAAVRNTTQTLMNFGVLSAALHTDPRYYQLGNSKPFKHRLIYAATRVLVTRKDNGDPFPNFAYIGGVAASSALTNAYYPHRDRSAERTVAGIFTSMGTRVATLEWAEFRQDILGRIFHKH